MKLKLLILVFIASIGSFYAQWTPTGGPVGSVVIEDIFRHNSTDYISVKSCGLFSKNINDQHWTQIASYWFKNHTLSGDSLFVNVNSLPGSIIQNNIYFMDLSEGISLENQLLDFGGEFLTSSKSHLYVGTSTYLHQMKFDGTEITLISQGLPQEFDGPGSPLKSFIATENFLLCGTIDGFFITKIDEIDWELSSQGLEAGTVRLVKEDNNILFCVVNSNLYVSYDNGAQWTVIHNSLEEITATYVKSDTIIVASASNAMTISFDQGLSWESFYPDFSEKTIKDIKSIDGELFFITAEDGLFIPDNNGLSNMNSGLICSIIRGLDLVEGMPIAVGAKVVGINNDEWINVSPENINFDSYHSIVTSGDTIFLSIHTSFVEDHLIMYSLDTGTSWNHLNSNPPESGDDAYRMVTAKGRLYVSENDFLYYTEDLGISWTKIDYPEVYCNSISSLYVYNSQLYISTCRDGEVLKLQPNNELIEIGDNLPNRDVENIMFCGEFMIVKLLGKGIYKSRVDEDDWEQIVSYPDGLSDDVIRIRDYVYTDSILMVATNIGVLASLDFGKSYVEFNEGLLEKKVTALLIHSDSIYIGTRGNGVWKRGNIIDSIVATKDEILSNLIFNIYPNPTSNYLNISNVDKLPISVFVTDITGMKVMEAKNIKDQIDVNGLKPGLYFLTIIHRYKLYNNKFVISR